MRQERRQRREEERVDEDDRPGEEEHAAHGGESYQRPRAAVRAVGLLGSAPSRASAAGASRGTRAGPPGPRRSSSARRARARSRPRRPALARAPSRRGRPPGPPASSSATTRSTAASRSSASSCTSPIRSAVSASKRSPVTKSRRAAPGADPGEHERRDQRRDEPELHLGEPEDGVARGDHDVAAGEQARRRRRARSRGRAPRPAPGSRRPPRRARAAGARPRRSRRRRAPADGAHPLDVAAGAERRPVAGEHDRARVGRVAECGGQLGDRRRVERVAPLRPRERDAGEASVALDPNGAHSARAYLPPGALPSVRAVPVAPTGRVLPAAVVGVATVVALASAWHSGGHVWRRLDSGYRTYSAYTSTQRRHAPIDAIPLRSDVFDFYADHLEPRRPRVLPRDAERVRAVLHAAADRRRDRPLLPAPGGAGEEPARRDGRRHVRPRPVEAAAPATSPRRRPASSRSTSRGSGCLDRARARARGREPADARARSRPAAGPAARARRGARCSRSSRSRTRSGSATGVLAAELALLHVPVGWIVARGLAVVSVALGARRLGRGERRPARPARARPVARGARRARDRGRVPRRGGAALRGQAAPRDRRLDDLGAARPGAVRLRPPGRARVHERPVPGAPAPALAAGARGASTSASCGAFDGTLVHLQLLGLAVAFVGGAWVLLRRHAAPLLLAADAARDPDRAERSSTSSRRTSRTCRSRC